MAKAVEAGVYPDTLDALLTLYASTSRDERSKIKSVVPGVEALDGTLRFPTALTERAYLDLARALEEDASLADTLRIQFQAGASVNESAEVALLMAPAPTEPGKIDRSSMISEERARFEAEKLPEATSKLIIPILCKQKKRRKMRKIEKPSTSPWVHLNPFPAFTSNTIPICKAIHA